MHTPPRSRHIDVSDGGLLDATANQQERALVNTVLSLAGAHTCRAQPMHTFISQTA
jgi:hypothetical protein